MQDRKGSDPGYLVPGTWYLAPVPHSHISNLNKALFLSCIMHTPCASFSKTGAKYRVSGIGYRLSGTWDLVPGT
jgi:hypothetical protein